MVWRTPSKIASGQSASSICLLMERVLFLLESVCLSRHRKVCCGCTLKLHSCHSPCVESFVWTECLRLSPKGFRAWPFLLQWILAWNNSFLGMSWTWMSYSSHVAVRLHICSAFWWDTQRHWAQLWRLMAMATCVGAGEWKQVPGMIRIVILTIHAERSLSLCCLVTISECHMWCL